MQSAFGVDHGEISKARLPKLPGVKAKPKGVGGPSGPQRVKGALKRAVEAPVSVSGIGSATGAGLRGFGSFLERKPGLTGTTLVGGGGAAGYKYLSDRQPKKKP